MALYLINCTKQKLRFQCRLLDSNRVTCIEVHSGKQIRADKHPSESEASAWAADQVRHVIEQMERYGFKDAAEVGRLGKEFIGIMYSNRPVGEDEILIGHDALVEMQEHRAAKEATNSALSFDAISRDGKGNNARRAKKSEVSVEQLVPKNEKPTGKELSFSVSVEDGGSTDAKVLNV